MPNKLLLHYTENGFISKIEYYKKMGFHIAIPSDRLLGNLQVYNHQG